MRKVSRGLSRSFRFTELRFRAFLSTPKYRKTLLLGLTFLLTISTAGSVYFRTPKVAGAATSTWDLATPGDYIYDNSVIDVTGGLASLKLAHLPGSDWIPTASGNDWGFRSALTVTNNVASVLTDYPVQYTLNTAALVSAGKLQSNCADLRFTTNDGATAVNYWLQSGCNTTTTLIWIKVPSIAASSTATVYMYYGNASATAASDGTGVFLLFDDFSGSVVDTSKWVVTNPHNTIFENGGNLEFTYGSGSGNWDWAVRSVQSFARGDYAFEFDQKRTSSYSPYNAFMSGWTGGGSPAYPSWVYALYDQGDGGCSSTSCPGMIYESGSSQGNTSASWSPNVQYYSQIRMRAAGGAYYAHTTTPSPQMTPEFTSNNSTAGNLYVGWSAYSGDWVIDNARVRPWVATEPTIAGGGEATLYPTTAPTVENATGQGFSTLSLFNDVAGAGSTGSITYQLSPDNGSSWYYWNGSAWSVTFSGTNQSNTAGVINTHLASFATGGTQKTLKWKAYLNSNGVQQPKLDTVSISYIWDTVAPDNPTTLTAHLNQSGGATTLVDGTWYNYPAPYFSWAAPSDNADTGNGEVASGVAGYYVYFGTDATASPQTAGVFQTGTSFTAASLNSGSKYYLRIQTKDNAGNTQSSISDLFTYKFDNTIPATPAYVSVGPPGYTSINEYNFIWPVSGSGSASDPGAPSSGSGIAGYQYKTAASSGPLSSWSSITADGSVDLSSAAYQEGTNIFYLRTVDNAGNVSAPIQATFYFSGSAPSAPLSLQASPASSAGSPQVDNSFSFTWSPPATHNAAIKQYRYSINALPTAQNSTIVTTASLPSGAYATQQGKNTLYVVAEDEAGNINYDAWGFVDFYAQTAAPGTPTVFTAVDGSIRDLQDYKVFLTWKAPSSLGTGFAGYEVYRSTDGTNFSSVGTTSGTTFADTNLESIQYTYYVKSLDNAGQYSVPSSLIIITPTGRYTKAPAIVDGPPDATTKAFSAQVTWETDRDSSSFIEYGTDPSKLGEQAGGRTTGKLDLTKKHEVQLTGLNPETVYYYQAVWVDSDGNKGHSDTATMKTGLRPKISDVVVSGVGTSSAFVSWNSTTVSTSQLLYGVSPAYGGVLTDQSGSLTTRHTTQLTGLEDGTTYHFAIVGTDTDGNELRSDDYSFATVALPRISNLRFESVPDQPTTTVKVTWTTNVTTSSVVTYSREASSAESVKSALTLEHEIIVADLLDQSIYKLQASGRDQFGNPVVSDQQTFTTPIDTRPPVISGLTIETQNSGTGADAKAQVVVSWNTDEPSTSQVEYGNGISGDFTSRTVENATLTTSHVVILSELTTAQSYHLRALSFDNARNKAESISNTITTGAATDSVISIILNRLNRSFGFLKGFGIFGK